jgi:polygalacturonase
MYKYLYFMSYQLSSIFSIFTAIMTMKALFLTSLMSLAQMGLTRSSLSFDEATVQHRSNYKVFDVTKFGAVGDARDDTDAIRRAVSAAAKMARYSTNSAASSSVIPRTIIYFPPNKTFMTAPINITNMERVTFHVDATLIAITNSTRNFEGRWPAILPFPSYGYSRDKGLFLQHQPFIFAKDVVDLIIQGHGTIDGQGWWWWDYYRTHSASELKGGRPNLVGIVNCTNVEVKDITLQNSPFWTLRPVYSTNIHIHHITIKAPPSGWNVDGIDPDSSKNVLIEYNDITSEDDHIAIKAGICGGSSPTNHCHDTIWSSDVYTTRNVTVRYNTMRRGMGITMGSEVSGGIEDVLVHDNVIGRCEECGKASRAMHLKTAMTRGGFIRNIAFRHNTIYNASAGFLVIETNYPDGKNSTPLDYPVTKIQNITVQNNRGLGIGVKSAFMCSEHLRCEQVTVIDNIIVNGKSSDWECSYVESYTVTNNYPPGLGSCMHDSMNRTGSTSTRRTDLHPNGHGKKEAGMDNA